MCSSDLWNLMVLLLLMGGFSLNGCSKDSVDNEDDNLGASRPIPNMLSDLSQPGTTISWTTWESHSLLSYSMKIEFNNTECTYTYKKSGTEDTTSKYTYNFNYPTVTFTSTDEDKNVIIGTITSYAFKADDITFKNSKDETVWMQMVRKK
mgnify:CR=1 FL=1